MTQILFHGSTFKVMRPLANFGRKNLDFGPGFYLTPLRNQAESWARRMRVIKKARAAYVNSYEFSMPEHCRVRTFAAYDAEWLDFMVKSRQGLDPWRDYDIVEGGVADDRVIDSVEAYISGYADIETTLSKLIYHKPNLQICILSQEVINRSLTFLSADIL